MDNQNYEVPARPRGGMINWEDWSGYTPMIQQYLEVKKEHKEELLFFRLGDFYEMFFEDAVIASRALNLTLTKRAGGSDKMPMCGVPYHSVEGYLAKLIKQGFRIAICEQVQDPREAKGIVERKVIKIITPGTALNEQLLEEQHNRYLVLVQHIEGAYILAAADVSTGACQWYEAKGEEGFLHLTEELYRLAPAELVLPSALSKDLYNELSNWVANKLPDCIISKYNLSAGEGYFCQHFPSQTVAPQVQEAVEQLLNYLHSMVMADLSHIHVLQEIVRDSYMNLDVTAIRNLELVKNMQDGGKRGSLLAVLDFTKTSMGARRLRSWIESPLLNIGQIMQRQEAVGELAANLERREAITEQLKMVADLERIVSRLEVGTANGRDLVALRSSLEVLPALKELLLGCSSRLLQRLGDMLELERELYVKLMDAIVDEPPFSIREGGMIRTGYNSELDELHTLASDSKAWMQSFEQRIKENTGIKTLKVGYNKVFGYYIEVSKGQANNMPDYFVRKQTLVNAERFIVPELKDFENKILSAKEKIESLEYYLFNELRDLVRSRMNRLQETAKAISVADSLNSLAQAAYQYSYVKPELNNQGEIRIADGRHPVVERLLKKELFVPNDTLLNANEQQLLIITGPNMAGKSTYMRQVALLTLMTQIGSFIPARSANICPVDKIFTRVGASDDLATGQSTFMVEMNEVAQILKFATKNSLIILDEVGRGTSTFDGMSIARAVMEYIQTRIKAKTLFATHYHQLMSMEQELPGVKNYSVAVKERGKDIVFLRRIVAGGTDKSYGVHVARLAGLPKKVLERAEKFLEEYDSQRASEAAAAPKQQEDPMMGSLFCGSQSGVTERLLKLDVLSLTPIEAMNELFKLQAEAKKESGL